MLSLAHEALIEAERIHSAMDAETPPGRRDACTFLDVQVAN